jgi:hypothetical protein
MVLALITFRLLEIVILLVMVLTVISYILTVIVL